MKTLKQYIKEEISRLQEREYAAPPEILDVLRDKLKMDPLNRYIKKLKAVNSIPPSYRIFLHNGKFFDLYIEEISIVAKIGPKTYWLINIDEKNYAIKDINRLLTKSNVKPEEEEGEEDIGGDIPPPPEGDEDDIEV